jgi:hypothetical protein
MARLVSLMALLMCTFAGCVLDFGVGGEPPLDGDSNVTPSEGAAASEPPGTVVDTESVARPDAGTTPSNQRPTVTFAASASPAVVTGSTTFLQVRCADDGGEAELTHAWATLSSPPGGSAQFSANGTYGARDTTVTFNKVGDYTFRVTVADRAGLTVTSSVAVRVDASVTSIAVLPSNASVSVSGAQQFTAAARDQFKADVSPSPAFSWSVTGGGTISATGLFQAGMAAGGPFTVQARTATVVGNGSFSVGGCGSLGISSYSTSFSQQENWFQTVRFVSNVSFQADVLEAFVVSGTGARISLAIYEDVAGNPGTRLGHANEITSAVEGWNTAELSAPLGITAGVTYWLAFNTNSAPTAFGYSSVGNTKWRALVYDHPLPSVAGDMEFSAAETYSLRARSTCAP